MHTRLTFLLALILSGAGLLASCDGKDEQAAPQVPGQTSIRLVHSSAISRASPLDLYVEDVKLTPQPISFSGVSAYFPISGGSKKILVKTTAGATIRDTTISIREGSQYSVFVKEWLKAGSASPSLPTPVREFVIAQDNKTTVPAAGEAKVRFVNSVTTGPDLASGSRQAAIFLRVNPAGPLPPTQVLTFNLSHIASDFLALPAGPITFRATVPNTLGTVVTVTSPEMRLEEGRLYTLYLQGSPGGTTATGTVVPSSLELKITPNN
ncbi:MAG: DUF4397 domain-containing protein [Adhaeribacter sp.]